MLSWKSLPVLIVLFAGSTYCPAQTPTQSALKPGDILVYESVDQSKLDGGNLPAMAYKLAQTPARRTITIVTGSADPTGGMQIEVTSHKEPPSNFNAALLKAFETMAGGKFKARLTPEGAFLIAPEDMLQASDGMQGTQGMSLSQVRDTAVAQTKDPVYLGKVAATEIDSMFSVPNSIALSCGKRQSIVPGDTWRVVSKPDGNTYDVAVSAKQTYRGHDVMVLNAKGHSESGGITRAIDATIYYDPAARLLIGMHTVSVQTIPQRSMTMTLTSELNLKQ
jgi:hypothetical protein